jgi:hypothetical protein
LVAERAAFPLGTSSPPCAKKLRYTPVIDPEEPPLRPERHIPYSIATMRMRLMNALAKCLPRCPACGAIAAASTRRRS